MYTHENKDKLLNNGQFDFIVDAIDDIQKKTDLIIWCYKTNIWLMGVGEKFDNTHIHFKDIGSVFKDVHTSKLWSILKR